MVSSAEIALLGRIAELAIRLGLRPSDADATLRFVDDAEDRDKRHERLEFAGEPPGEAGQKFDKMMELLGCDDCVLKTNRLRDMEDIVERAIALAPRVRAK